MIGQQKRPLEHTVSLQPLKYQKHSDDNLCEAHPRVVSLTDEEVEFQQHFCGASQKNVFFVSPGASCDSRKLFDRTVASDLPVPCNDKDILEPENGAWEISQKGFIVLEEYEAIRTAVDPFAQSAKELTTKGYEEETRHSLEAAIKTQGNQTLENAEPLSNTDSPPLSTSGASLNVKMSSSWGLLGSTSRKTSLPLGDEQIGLHHATPGPIIPIMFENNVEGDVSLQTVHGEIEAQHSNGPQPLPVVMSEKVIDLYRMDEWVQSFGGYKTVTSEGLWGSISEALGFESDCGPGLKLIYFKYFRGLERERRLLSEGLHDNCLLDSVNMRVTLLSNMKRLVDENDENYSLMAGEEFAESESFRGKLEKMPRNSGNSYGRWRDAHLDHSGGETETRYLRREGERAMLGAHRSSDKDHGDSLYFGNCSFSQECDDSPVAVLPDCRLLKGQVDNHSMGHSQQGTEMRNNVEGQDLPDKAILERDSKSLANTLTWIKRMALEPRNPSMGQGPEGTGQNEKWVIDCASRAYKVRALLWKRRDDMRAGDGHLHQWKQIVAPSLYYEELPRQEQQSLERLRATRERVAHYATTNVQKPLHEWVNSQRGSYSSLNQPEWVGQTSHCLPRQSHYYEERYVEETLDKPRKRIPVGPEFQACIPICRAVDHSCSVADSRRTGPIGDETESSDEDDEDNSRWLGKQVWPPPGSERFVFKDQLGPIRPSFCSCLDPESLNCVRVHILEERGRLEEELGQAFYIWKFDHMGESVADNWTKDEECTFRALVKMNPPSQDKNFWDQLPEAFPGKKMKELVSYYFNVFVVRRRAIQNRLGAKHVDSDDDETDLPEDGSEDSDDYKSGDEGDEDADENASEEENEIDKEVSPYEGASSAKRLGDIGFCDLGGVNMVYSSKMGVGSAQDESQGAPLSMCSTCLMSLEDVQQGYHDSHEGISVRVCTAHLTAKWSREHDDEKNIEEHISNLGEEELQEVKTWETCHWDEGVHEDSAHEPVAKGISKGEQLIFCAERAPSPYKKVRDGTNQHTSLGSGDGGVWGTTLDIAPLKERDKLFSTTGMIQEFFGNEASGVSTSR